MPIIYQAIIIALETHKEFQLSNVEICVSVHKKQKELSS